VGYIRLHTGRKEECAYFRGLIRELNSNLMINVALGEWAMASGCDGGRAGGEKENGCENGAHTANPLVHARTRGEERHWERAMKRLQ